MSAGELVGWDRLRHGGLLLDPKRAGRFAEAVGAQRHALADEDCGCKKDVLRKRERRLATYQRGETWNEAL